MRGFRGDRGDGDKEGGDPFSSPLQMQCCQLAPRRDCWLLMGALAVLTLANASGYNQEPETSASHGKEQRRVEIRALRWEFPGWSKRKA